MVVAGQDFAFRSLSVPRLLGLAGGSWQALLESSPLPRASPLQKSVQIAAAPGAGTAAPAVPRQRWCWFSWCWGELWEVLTFPLSLELLCSPACSENTMWTLSKISADFKVDLGSLFPSLLLFQGISHVPSPRLLWVLRNFLTYKNLELKLI